MNRKDYKRASSIDSDFTNLEKNLPRIVSDLARDVELVIMMTGFLHDNILNNKGDLGEGDRADFNESFTPVLAGLQDSLNRLQDCYNVYNDDPNTYAQNLADFIVKYPSAASEEVEKRYS